MGFVFVRVLTTLTLLAAFLLISSFRGASASIYDRPFHFLFAISGGGRRINHTDAQILSAFSNMPVKPSMLLQVVLNKKDITNGKKPTVESFVIELKKIVPNLCFGVGLGKQKDPIGQILHNSSDWDWFMDRARLWRNYTDCISLEAFDTLVINTDDATMVSFLNTLHDDYGYNHIVANPWKGPSNASIVWPYIDAAFVDIRPNDNNKWYDAWHPRFRTADKIHANNPRVKVMMNYENAPTHIALTELGRNGSIEAMQIAVDDQLEYAGVNDIYWAPPWTRNYDPLNMDTWDWIQATFAELYENETTTSTTSSTTDEAMAAGAEVARVDVDVSARSVKSVSAAAAAAEYSSDVHRLLVMTIGGCLMFVMITILVVGYKLKMGSDSWSMMKTNA